MVGEREKSPARVGVVWRGKRRKVLAAVAAHFSYPMELLLELIADYR